MRNLKYYSRHLISFFINEVLQFSLSDHLAMNTARAVNFETTAGQQHFFNVGTP
jgi:hypothetical protein